MPTFAPTPAATMRSGRLGSAPGVTTRTGCIAWMPSPGASLRAMKSNPAVVKASMVGCIAAGTSYPFACSQAPSASPCEERTVTASYGPTTSCETTCTVSEDPESKPALPSKPAAPALDALLPHPPPPLPSYSVGTALPQDVDGPWMTVCVDASSEAIHESCDSSMTAPGLTGNTHAKLDGAPAYLIWSHSTVCVCDSERTMRWSVTTVPTVWSGLGGSWKHPPQARASPASATSQALASARAHVAIEEEERSMKSSRVNS